MTDDEGDGMEFPQGFFMSHEDFKKYIDQQKQAAVVGHHEVNNWLLEREADDLKMIDHLLAGSIDPRPMMIRGVISGILISRGFCQICNSTHDPNVELAELHATEEPPVSEAVRERQYKANCEKWNVTPNEANPPQVICLGCGMNYVSLEDRMLRSPGIDGCSGCQHKSAHG